MNIDESERKRAREILAIVETWQTDAEMIAPNIERLPGINKLAEMLRPMFENAGKSR